MYLDRYFIYLAETMLKRLEQSLSDEIFSFWKFYSFGLYHRFVLHFEWLYTTGDAGQSPSYDRCLCVYVCVYMMCEHKCM